jgi:hypothetical protein
MPVPIYVTLLRLLTPLTIFKWPLWGVLASSFLDLRDWEFINFKSPSDYVFYQNWDKAMDLYYLTFAFITTLRWKDKIAQKLAFFLFFYRVIGDILFWSTQNRAFLFIFSNFFESFFIFYLLFVFLFKKVKLFTSWKIIWPLLIAIFIPKLVIEYFLHILQKQIWEVYNFSMVLGFPKSYEANVNFFAQGMLLYLFPFILGFYLVRKIQKNS